MGPVYRHVIFDLDGTLIDSLADITAAVNHVRGRLGLTPLARDRVRSYIGEGARVLIERALGADNRGAWEDGLRCYLDYYADHCLEETHAYPGIDGALHTLAARRIVLSVLTNKPEVISRNILTGLGILTRFTAVLGGDSLRAPKPDAAGVERLCRAAGTPPERVLLVGDSLVDARTAAAARVSFCGVAWGFASAALSAAGVGPIAATPAELVTLILGPVTSDE